MTVGPTTSVNPAERAELTMILPTILACPLSDHLGVHPPSSHRVPSSWGWSETRAVLPNGFWLNTSWSWNNPLQFPYSSGSHRFPLVLWRYVLPVAAIATLGVGTLHVNSEQSMRPHRVAAVLAVALLVVALSTGTHMPGGPVCGLLSALPHGWPLSDPVRLPFIAGMGYAALMAILIDRSLLLSGMSGTSLSASTATTRVAGRGRLPCLASVALWIGVIVSAFPHHWWGRSHARDSTCYIVDSDLGTPQQDIRASIDRP